MIVFDYWVVICLHNVAGGIGGMTGEVAYAVNVGNIVPVIYRAGRYRQQLVAMSHRTVHGLHCCPSPSPVLPH